MISCGVFTVGNKELVRDKIEASTDTVEPEIDSVPLADSCDIGPDVFTCLEEIRTCQSLRTDRST